MRNAAGFGGDVLKTGDRGAEDELLRGADGVDGGEDFVAYLLVLAREIEHGNGLRIAV
jgi:hypothetical protein